VVNLAGNANQPGLFELLGQPESAPWRVWAELAPATASAYRIADGSTVRLTSAAGSIEAVAVVADGMPPDTIALAYVPALPAGGRWARLNRADARSLWGRERSTRECAVRITRA
jgi:anaerobic selenocysteine-containing dehydrogenase